MDSISSPAAQQPRKKPKLELPGKSTPDIGLVRAKYQQGPFNYQFLMPDGNHRSRVMYCDNPGELEFIARTLNKKTEVFIQSGPRLVPRRT